MMCGGKGEGDAQGTLSAAYTESDGLPQRAAERLWALLKLRAARYTMGDHASLPTAIMEELLVPVMYDIPGRDDVARVQRGETADVRDDARHVKNHVVQRALLHHTPIQARFERRAGGHLGQGHLSP